MTDRYAEIKDKISEYAKKDGMIRAVIAIGSSVRAETPADKYSDLDLVIVTAEPEKWFSGEYPGKLGKVSVSFIEPTLGGGRERRCIYDEDKDVDMIVLTPEQFDTALKEGVMSWIMDRGYLFLYGADEYAEAAAKYVRKAVSRPEMTEEEFINTANDFYFHNIWAYKKLLRGELWSAKMCVDAYLKQRLLKMIEQYALARGTADVWHDGRFIDRWADSETLNGLRECFAHYDTEDCKRALLATHRLFAELASAVAEIRGFVYPENAEVCAKEFINK